MDYTINIFSSILDLIFYSFLEFLWNSVRSKTYLSLSFWDPDWIMGLNELRIAWKWSYIKRRFSVPFRFYYLEIELLRTAKIKLKLIALIKKETMLIRRACKLCELKNVNSPKGGGFNTGNQNVHNSKCGLFDKRGEAIFSIFPKCKCKP